MSIFDTKDRWSLTKEEYIRFINEHRKAHERNDKSMMEKIEDRLEDINYHPEARALENHEYEKAERLWDDD